MSIPDEQSLVARAKRGDREALGALWNALTPRIFGYLINTMRDRTLAEDILQATWLKAITALPRFEKRGIGISAWLFVIARNECREHWRRSGRITSLDPTKHDSADGDGETIKEKILAEQILASLPESDREILRLRYIADLSLNELAQVLELNFVTVRVRIHRALARARTTLTSITPKTP